MKTTPFVLVLAGLVVMALASAGHASAATVVIAGNDFYSIGVGTFGIPGSIIEGSELSFDWSSDMPLTLVVSGPFGAVQSYTASTHGSDTIDIDDTGMYSMTWTNSGSSAATLTYDYEVDLFPPAEDAIDAIVLGLIVVAIVIIAIIVLVVVLVLRSGKRSEPAKAPGYGQAAAPVAESATNCPNCGAAIDRTNQWCSKCGAKLR